MKETVIQAHRLGKAYLLGEAFKFDTLRDQIAAKVRAFFKNQASSKREVHGNSTFWALKEVSFEIQRGEAVGIIGRNGAGKSTLLKVLAEITEPSAGYVKIDGRLSSLLEVGTGFHPELTGRENIFLNGAVLGMTKREIRSKFNEIVDFAEVEKFIDTPVKRYSSGMQVRLAFSVAAHLESEILLIDEVLAVGDIAFQRKCMGKMDNVAGQGRTVFFVSHNMASIKRLCTRAICLDNGRIINDGRPVEVIERYIEKSLKAEAIVKIPSNKHKVRSELQIKEVRLENVSREPKKSFFADEQVRISLNLVIKKPVFECLFGVEVFTEGVLITSILSQPLDLDTIGKEYKLTCTLLAGILLPGTFELHVGAGLENTGRTLDWIPDVMTFNILRANKNVKQELNRDIKGYFRLQGEWTLN